MKKELQYIKNIRNVGIIAHIDAGKTTVSERMLFYTDKIHRMGEVHDGNATMDFMPEEQERGITISAATTCCYWNDNQINLIDTPGHVDFTIEVERSLRVLDGAIGIFCAVGAVEPQSETVWRQADNLNVPRLVFINKIDRIGADFENVLKDMKNKLNANPIALQIPLGQGEDFYGIADLIHEKKLNFSEDDQGRSIVISELDPKELEQVKTWKQIMLESLADQDDDFLDLYLSDSYTLEDIKTSLRKSCINGLINPTLVGSALKNSGIQPLLDAVCDYLPSPLNISPLNSAQNEEFIRPEKLQALIFKVILENKRKVALVRIYQGQINERMDIYNVNQKKSEKISLIYRLHADYKEQIQNAKAGEIIAIMGIKSAQTGDTLGFDSNTEILENLLEYKPVISLAFEPKNSEDALILDEALEKYCLEDPTINTQLEEISGNRLVSGMGELHLEVLQERLNREYKIFPRVGNPQVILRETIENQSPIVVNYLFDKIIGESRQYGEISLQITAGQRNSDNLIIFADNCFDLTDYGNDAYTMPKKEAQMIKEEILQNIQNNLSSGPQTGYPVQDILVEITKIKKESQSTVLGFQMASNFAIKEALEKAKLIILEPIMNVEIQVPDQSLGSCINLINICNGKVEELTDKTGLKNILALAPMRELFGFSTKLRSATQGRANLQIRFHCYDKA